MSEFKIDVKDRHKGEGMDLKYILIWTAVAPLVVLAFSYGYSLLKQTVGVTGTLITIAVLLGIGTYAFHKHITKLARKDQQAQIEFLSKVKSSSGGYELVDPQSVNVGFIQSKKKFPNVALKKDNTVSIWNAELQGDQLRFVLERR